MAIRSSILFQKADLNIPILKQVEYNVIKKGFFLDLLKIPPKIKEHIRLIIIWRTAKVLKSL